jgi:hypothetical protein
MRPTTRDNPIGARWRRAVGTALAAGLAAALAVVADPTAAQAATWYYYKPGHPTYLAGGGTCTGGYAIRGASGMFFLTDGHCTDGATGVVVSGTDTRFGTVAYNKYPGRDTALIRPDAGVDAYQIVVDPKTGRTPGTGRVIGEMPGPLWTVGTLVGKMGVTSGWTEGKIVGYREWHGLRAVCSTALTQRGDSGGPVWRNDPYGDVYAVGITVTFEVDGGCFLPMNLLLSEWGAWLPVFASTHAVAGPRASAAHPVDVTANLPRLSSEGMVSAVG